MKIIENLAAQTWFDWLQKWWYFIKQK